VSAQIDVLRRLTRYLQDRGIVFEDDGSVDLVEHARPTMKATVLDHREAAAALRVKSCLIDGEAVAWNGDGLPVFDRLRYRRDDRRVFLYAFDLLQLDSCDLILATARGAAGRAARGANEDARIRIKVTPRRAKVSRPTLRLPSSTPASRRP